MNIITILRVALILFTLASTAYFIKDIIAHKEDFTREKFGTLTVIGFVTNFFDTWGIGSYAPTMAGFKFTKSSADETIPGTLNIGDTLPVSMEAILFFTFVDIDPFTLVAMLAAAILGAVLGAGVVCKWNVRYIRIGLGAGLMIMAFVLACKNAQIGPFGIVGTATALHGIKLVIGLVCNFILGAFMMIGIGLYAPCTALVAMLGMNVKVAFPIMMGSCAFLMNAACFKFIKEGKYDRKAAFCLAFPGALGVVVAYLLIKYAFSVKTLTYIICLVMVYTSIMFIRDAIKNAAR